MDRGQVRSDLLCRWIAAIRKMAERYTDAWCSRSATAVASFFDEQGQSTVNGGPPAIGRAAIASEMQAFFADFPDLALQMDDIRSGGNQAVYLWTLTGSNSGTGNAVQISGWQNWRLTDDLLIVEADGGFGATEYERRIREGI